MYNLKQSYNRNYGFSGQCHCQSMRTSDIATTWCQGLLMDERTGIRPRSGRDGVLTADFSLSKRWREQHLICKKKMKKKKKKSSFPVYVPILSIALFLSLQPINTSNLLCFEWLLNGIHVLGLCLSGTQMFVFVFSSNTANNRQI